MKLPLLLGFGLLACSALHAGDSVDLNALLEPLRVSGKLPGLAAAVIRDGQLHAVGAVGVRKEGDAAKVELSDRWHLGSCTKSMTATLAAMLVEEGKFRWDETLPQLLPVLAPKMNDGWKPVTLEQLLAHRGGAPHDLNQNGLWGRVWGKAGEAPLDQRVYLAKELLGKQAPAQAVGSFVYSNSGYSLVGHAIELRLGKPWEAVLNQRLFEPLKLSSGGFGMPATLGKTDQPWGHARNKEGALRPIPPGLQADNPAAIGPGGTAHLSITDFATYAAFHIQGQREGHKLLSAEGFRKLHTPLAKDGDYGLGWVVTSRPWGGGEVLNHNGTNTTNYAVMWLAPKRNFGVVICTNAGGGGVDKAVDDVAGMLIGKFAPKK